MTEDYARLIGRFAFLWAWPMVNVHNRLAAHEKLSSREGGVLPVAPPNQLCMIRDYIEPIVNGFGCPEDGVLSGFCVLAFDREPVVLQVPDFGDRFWIFRALDQRTDSFANLGKQYGTTPGFYLLAGPGWDGELPSGFSGVFRCSTRAGVIKPLVAMDETEEDPKDIEPIINQVITYPLSRFNGKMRSWNSQVAQRFSVVGTEDPQVNWVTPEDFFDVLPLVLDEVPPLPGEEKLYRRISSILQVAAIDSRVGDALKQAAKVAQTELVAPLSQFHNFGVPLPHNWGTVVNGADFDTDYVSRTAVASSNIFVGKSSATRCFYQDLDERGYRLNGTKRYRIKFEESRLPPVKGFWSLTLYDEQHRFYRNELKRYSLGTRNKSLNFDEEGSLTLYIQSEPPEEHRWSNWLCAPDGNFSLCIRAYWPDAAITDGAWTPPPVIVAGR